MSCERFLDHNRFFVFPEDASHGVGNLADGGGGLDRRKNPGHNVGAGSRGVFNRS